MTHPKIATAMLLAVTAAVASAAPITPALGSTITYDFNTPGQLTSDLTFDSGAAAVTQAAVGGLSNSGSVQGAAGNVSQSTVVAKNAVSTSTASDFTLTQSAYFKTSPANSLGTFTNQPVLILGITDSATQSASAQNLLPNPTANSLAGTVTVNNPNNSGNITLEFDGFQTGDIGPFGPPTTVTVAPDSWLFFEVDYAYESGADQWRLTYTLSESDADGVVGTQLFNLTLNGAVRSNLFGADPDLYGWFGTDTQLDSSVTAFDNITLVGVIPEPGSLGLLSLGGLAMLRCRRG
ncbi:MAG: PEP-CTERM sorting domain-containing protein [Planctomycetota bacterium]